MVGGLTKSELLQELQSNARALNEFGARLFASDRFMTSATRYAVPTVELAVRDLGFRRGATIAEIYGRAGALSLVLCPLELAPHLRLQYLDQPEGYWGHPVEVDHFDQPIPFQDGTSAETSNKPAAR
ncbi:MAG TPA: hypothetical protein VLA19_25355 [Herpetosiphonaceae bacterium]|nr:hypothetical protein [Herpetosiphonaceae bacterium]